MRTRNLWISCRCGWTGIDEDLAGDLEHPECPKCHTTFTTYPSRKQGFRQLPAEAGEVR